MDKIKVISKVNIYDDDGILLIEKGKIYDAEIVNTGLTINYNILLDNGEIPLTSNSVITISENRDKKINEILDTK